MPLAPRLQRKMASASPARQERLLVADRHARGRVDEVAVRVEPPRAACRPGSVELVELVELGLDRLRAPRARPSSQAPASPLAVLAPRRAPPSRRRARSGRRAGSPPPGRVGSFQPPRGSTTIWSAPRSAASQARSGLLVGISPKRRTRSGDERGRSARRAAAGRRPRRRASGRGGRSAAARSARRGSGSRRRGRGGRAARAARVELAAGDDHPRGARRDVLGDLVEQELPTARGRSGSTAVSGPLAAALAARAASVAVTAPSTAARRQRLAPGEVEVDRARARLAARGGEGAAGDRAVVEQPVVVGVVGADFAEPAHRGAVELELVDRLPGADPAQLRRAVGGEHDQRHRRLVGLADRRVEVGGRGARGAEHADRRAARLRGAEREEGGGALVDDHASPRSPAGARAPRASGVEREPGESDRVPQPAARQLLDEGRGERGVALVGSTGD